MSKLTLDQIIDKFKEQPKQAKKGPLKVDDYVRAFMQIVGCSEEVALSYSNHSRHQKDK